MSAVLKILGTEAMKYIEEHPEVVADLLNEGATALVNWIKKKNQASK